MKFRVLFILAVGLIFACGIATAATYTCDNYSDCNGKIEDASAGDTVYLTANITNHSSTCIEFNDVDGVTFDCQGNMIDGTTRVYGIYLYASHNNTIKNCKVSQFNEGVYIYYSNNNTLTNNTVFSNYNGIYILYSYNNTVTYNLIYSNSYRDIYQYPAGGNYGSENSCDMAYNWDDEGVTGCKYDSTGATTTTSTSTTSTSTTSTSTTSTTTILTFPNGYCASYGGSTEFEYISDFTYAKNPSNTLTITANIYIANPTGCTYGDPCPEYDASPEYVNVWIDWNGDKVFDDGEKVIDDALTGYLNINYRGTMVSSHIVSIPGNAVNHTWMRANLGWEYDPDDPCYLYWTWGNVVDERVSIRDIPEIEDINVTGPAGNESHPMTMKEVNLRAIIKEAEDYEVFRISWWGDVENTEGPLGSHNPRTYVPARGTHGGDKIAGATISYRNTETGETGSATYSKKFDLFFAKQGDDDGDGDPNWFEYWNSDGTIQNMSSAVYNSTTPYYGFWNGAQVALGRRAAGQHYRNPIVIDTFFGQESFGGPNVTGADTAAEVIAHELYHKWVDDQWLAGGEFNGKTDTDKNYRPPGVTTSGNARNYDDQLPDFYENDTSHTNPTNNTDTYNLNDSKSSDYQFYGDQEYMAMKTGNGARADRSKDWANPGKQTPGISDASISLATIGIANGAGFARGELTGTSADEGNDTNGNSLYENLKFGAELNVTNAGLFTAVAFLIDSGGETVTYIISDFTIESGIQILVFEFDGVAIREHGVDGPYTVNLTVGDEEGTTLDMAAYATNAYGSTDFEMSVAGFTGGYADSGTDTDADGIYDYLTISVNVNVTEAGTYTVEGWLYDGNGEDIAYASDSRSLGVGVQSMELNFSGTAIANNRVNGPYTLKYLKLTDSDGKQVDFVGEAHNTSAYSYTEFRKDKGGAKFGNSYNDYSSDTNLDGIYDYLVIGVGVNVTDAGNYTLTGILYDSNGVDISTVSAESALSNGSRTMLLNFDGDDVYNNAVDGPYVLKYLVLQNNNGTQADYIEEAHNTAAYNHTDFASQPLLSLTGNYSDQGLDTNNNSLYDHLIIGVGVQVASDGNVILSARLVDSNENEIQWASNASYLYANQSSVMELKFNGTEINSNQVDGPYYLKDLYVYHTGDPDKSIYLTDAYTTSAHNYADFESGGECELEGDGPPCGQITLSEVVDFITLWDQQLADLADVIDLITAWDAQF